MLESRAKSHFFRHGSTRAGAVAIVAMLVLAVAGPALARHGPNESDFVHGLTLDLTPVGPCAQFPFGADRMYRDVLARLSFGARVSLTIAVAASLISSVLGATVGIVSGWFEGSRVRVPWPALFGCAGGIAGLGLGKPVIAALAFAAGWIASLARRRAGPSFDLDGWLMRLVDIMLAFPFLLLAMAIVAALQRTTAVTILLTLGGIGWLGIARILRAKTMQIRTSEYVEASRALGQSVPKLLVKHILPNVAGPLVVAATVQVAQMIVADSVLSYLGVGISPPTATWGRMLLEAQDDYLNAPWAVAAPGAAILLSVWGFNMLGEGLRDALDPNDT